MKDAGVLTTLVSRLHTTPQAADELMALWDGLPFEHQIQVLWKLNFPEHLQYDLLRQAMKNANAYVRYLAARHLTNTKFFEYEGHGALIDAIKNDISPVVRNSLLLEIEYDDLWALPHQSRLRIVRQMSGNLDFLPHIVEAIEQAPAILSSCAIKETEVLDVLSDMIKGEAFHEKFNSSWGVFSRLDSDESTDIEKEEQKKGLEIIHSLWLMVLVAPENISEFLFEHLPVSFKEYDLIPSDVVNALSPEKLRKLFNREDIWLLDKRRTIFHSTDEKFERIRGAAITHHFGPYVLDVKELDALLSTATQDCSEEQDKKAEVKKAFSMLGIIGGSAEDLSPVYYAILLDLYDRNLYDHMRHMRDELSGRVDLTGGLKKALRRSAEKGRDWEILQVRIFKWAAAVSRGWITITDEQKRSSTKAASLISNCAIKENNAWKTYKAFSTLDEKDFPFRLPRLEEIGEGEHDTPAIAELRRELKAALGDLNVSSPDGRINRAINVICSYCSKKENELKEVYDGFVELKRSQNLWAVLWVKVMFAIFIMLSIIIGWLIGGSIIRYLF